MIFFYRYSSILTDKVSVVIFESSIPFQLISSNLRKNKIHRQNKINLSLQKLAEINQQINEM